MIDIYKNVKTLVKLGTVHTDNSIFKLHYKVTVVLLAALSILLTSKQYFGDPINCDVEQRKEIIDTFCWIHGTFIVNMNLNDPYLPGLGIYKSETPITRQTYYQWICIIFAIQAVLFYLPRYLWKACEAGRLKQLVGDYGGPLVSDKWSQMAKDKLVKHILDETYLHNIYTFRYCCCELLNFFNIIANIYFTDWLLAGQFAGYGIAHTTYVGVSPMTKLFPKTAKCLYYNYGPGGGIQVRDALCILPLNVLNEKAFIVLWYWFFFLLVLTFLCVVYRGMFLFLPIFRIYLLRAQARKLERKKAKFIIDKVSFGTFFILYKFGKNVNPSLYKEVISCLYDHLVTRGSYKNYLQDI